MVLTLSAAISVSQDCSETTQKLEHANGAVLSTLQDLQIALEA